LKSIALVSTEKKRAQAKGGKAEKEVEKEKKKKKKKIEHRSNNRASASFHNTDALLRSHVDITSPSACVDAKGGHFEHYL